MLRMTQRRDLAKGGGDGGGKRESWYVTRLSFLSLVDMAALIETGIDALSAFGFFLFPATHFSF